MGNPWVGFDFDGTVAYDKPGVAHDPSATGEPIPEMLALMKQYINSGIEVRIFTARVSVVDPLDYDRRREVQNAERAVQYWCQKYLGQELRVTCCKDYDMVVLYDDRAIQVMRNAGTLFPVIPAGVDYREQGTAVAGYEELGPYHCTDCDHVNRENSSCHHPLVMIDPEMKSRRNQDGGIRINPERGCCKVVNQSDHGTKK